MTQFFAACTIPGQVYSDCHSACPSTCDQPGALICPAVCVQGCACGRGTVFDKNQRKCVPQSKCSEYMNNEYKDIFSSDYNFAPYIFIVQNVHQHVLKIFVRGSHGLCVISKYFV